MSKNNPFIIGVFFVTVAAAIRFFHLEDQSLWNDEMFSFDVASTAISGIQTKLVMFYHHPPLFFYLAHVCLKWLGHSAWALRWVSALSGALTVGLVYACASKLINHRTGILAATLCLIAPFHLAYSQEGRPYALAGFLCLLSFYLLFLVLEEPRRARILSYIASCLALLYTHHWGAFILVSHCIFVMFFSQVVWDKKRWLILSWVIIVLAYLPEFSALTTQISRSSPTGWFWVEKPSLAEAVDVLTAFSGTYFKMASSVFALPVVLRICGAISAAGLLVLGIISTLQRKENATMRGVLVVLGGTLLIPFFISLFRPEAFVWYRYTVIVFPLFCIVVACGVQDWRSIRAWALSVLMLIGILGMVQYFSWSKANVKDVAGFVDSVAQRDVQMIIRPRAFAPLFNYYYKGTATQYDEAYLETPLGEIIDTASSFVYISLEASNVIRDYMDNHFDKIAGRHFSGESNMGMIVGMYRQKPEER